MILILYYVVGFWLNFGLVMLSPAMKADSSDSTETGENSSSTLAAVALAIMWPIALPVIAAIRIDRRLHKFESRDKGAHGYPAA